MQDWVRIINTFFVLFLFLLPTHHVRENYHLKPPIAHSVLNAIQKQTHKQVSSQVC